MKSLNDYIDKSLTKAFKDNNAFFAFSDEQFNKSKIDGLKYVNLGAGLLCPEKNVKSLTKKLDNIITEGIKLDLKENGKTKIIERELIDREFNLYTSDFNEMMTVFKDYPITKDDVLKIINKNQRFKQ
jgi:hypothetical protein